MTKHPAIPFAAPFAALIILLVAGPHLPIGAWEQPLRVLLLTAALIVFSRNVIDLRPAVPLASFALGIAVFLIWIGPDWIWPGYRDHWLLQNAVTGQINSSIPPQLRSSAMVLVFRTIRAVILVPIIEELFWRGWLMRWLIGADFQKLPVGTYSARAFWITALLFASEHGSYWDVGLIAGIAYNWWVIRTKRLSDCILAHATTNALLCGYVIATGRWEYWM